MLSKLMRNRSLVILGFAESVSGVGSWVTMLAVFALIIFEGEGSVVQSTGVFVAALLPMLLLSPVAGWLADRVDRKRLMIISEILAGSAVAGLIFTESLPLIYGLIALQSSFNAVMGPARQAVIPELVPPEELTQANAFLQQLASIIKIAAPIISGVLLAIFDPHTAIVLDVISYGVSALILSRLPALSPPSRSAEMPESQADAVDVPVPSAWHVLRERPGLRLLFIGVFLTTVTIIGFDVLSAIVTRDVLRGDESLMGLLIGLVGLGTFVAAALLMLSKTQRDLFRDVILGLLLLSLLPLSATLGVWLGDPGSARVLLGAGGLLAGFGTGFIQVQASTLLQTLTPSAFLGRMGGIFQSTAIGGQMIGLLLTPLLVPGVLTVGTFFAIGSISLVVLAIYITAAVRRNTNVRGFTVETIISQPDRSG